jgi:hypothetical protein
MHCALKHILDKFLAHPICYLFNSNKGIFHVGRRHFLLKIEPYDQRPPLFDFQVPARHCFGPFFLQLFDQPCLADGASICPAKGGDQVGATWSLFLLALGVRKCLDANQVTARSKK